MHPDRQRPATVQHSRITLRKISKPALRCALIFSFAATCIAKETTAANNAPQWYEFSAGHISLLSDLEPAGATALIQKLLIFDRAVTDFIPDRNAHTPRLRIIVFAKRRDFLKVTARRHFAAFAHAGLNAITLVIGPGRGSAGITQNALHEYTHYLLRTQPLAFPAWYEEGLANVLERSKVRVADGQVVHGGYQINPNFALRQTDLRHILVQRPDQSFYKARYYTLSGLLTHFLLFGDEDYASRLPQHFAVRQQRLTRTLQLSDRALLRALDRHRRTMSKRKKTYRTTKRTFNVQRTPATAADIAHLVAQMSEFMNPAGAIKRYRRLLEARPQNPDLWTGLSRSYTEVDHRQAADALERALALNPRHQGALIQQAVLQTQDCPLDATMTCVDAWEDAATTLRRVLAEDPRNFDAAYRLGVTELFSGRADKALGYLRLAHQLAPWSPRINLHLGDCLRILGAPSAQEYLLNARAWAQDDVTNQLADAALDLLAATAVQDP